MDRAGHSYGAMGSRGGKDAESSQPCGCRRGGSAWQTDVLDVPVINPGPPVEFTRLTDVPAQLIFYADRRPTTETTLVSDLPLGTNTVSSCSGRYQKYTVLPDLLHERIALAE